MKLLSLKAVYKNLLSEAILDQSTFLLSLSDIAQNKPGTINDNSLVGSILKSIEKTSLGSLQGAENKKKRKKAEVLIHKNLKKIKGISGQPVDLKKMRPLYDSILEFLSAKKDVDIEHCLLAADYYMSDFYSSIDEEEKKLVDNGKMKFENVLRVTKFYQQYHEFKDSLGIFSDSYVKVYKDENINVVYPQTSNAFNSFIASTGTSVEWCTQAPSTWQGYNNSQFVMIIHQIQPNRLTSLKVDFNGLIDYEGTCDHENLHMNKYKVQQILPQKAEDMIKKMVEDGDVVSLQPENFKTENVARYASGLLDTNNFEEMFSLLVTVNYMDSSGDLLDDALDEIIRRASEVNKLEKAIEVIVDVAASLNFDSQNFKILLTLDMLRIEKADVLFLETLVNKCLNKRSHVKYFIALCSLYKSIVNMPINLKEINSKINQIAFNALDKSNPVNFKRVMLNIIRNKDLSKQIFKEENFPRFFASKGFKSYFSSKKENCVLINEVERVSGEVERFISQTIKKNRESFAEFVQSHNNEEQDNISFESLDFSMIAKSIQHKTKLSNFDVTTMNLESLGESTFELSSEDIDEIVNSIYTNVDVLKLICERNKFLFDTLLLHFYSSLEDSSRKNNTIDLNLKETSDVFFYLFNNSTEKIPSAINGSLSPNDTVKLFNSTIKAIKQTGNTIKSIEPETRELLTKTVNNRNFFSGLLENNFQLEENLVDFYAEIILNSNFDEESISIIKNSIFDLGLLNNNLSNTSLEKLVSKLLVVPEIKSSIVRSAQSGKDDISNAYNIFYLSKYSSVSRKIITQAYIKYISVITDSRDDNQLQNNNLIESSNQINQIIVSYITITNEITESVGSLIDKNTFWNNNSFKNLVVLMVIKCNKTNVTFSKKHLAKVFYSDNFKRLNTVNRQEILTNFISKSSDNEDNYLNTSDRAVVKKCLKDCLSKGNNLSQDYDFIMSLCKNLDRSSRFHLRTVFPKETTLLDKDVNESTIKSYIRLFLG